MGVFDEYNRFQSEVNERAQERQVYDEHKSFNEVNQNANIRPSKKNKIFANFMFTCAAVAVLPLGIYVPVFSEVFSPQTIVEAGEAVDTATKPEYDISILALTNEGVNCTIKVVNVDLSKENYYVYVVKEADALDSFFAGVAESVKQNYCTKITNISTDLTFTKYMHATGGAELDANMSYAIVLVNEDKIVYKQHIKLANKYVKGIVVNTNVKDKNYRYLDVKALPSDSFSEFDSFYFELYNVSTHTLDPHFYAIIPKANLSDNFARFAVKLGESACDYELRIYCSTSHPEKLGHPYSFVKDDTTYYLIYTHECVINF